MRPTRSLLGDGDADLSLLGEHTGVDIVDALVQHVLEHPFEQGSGQGIFVKALRLAPVDDLKTLKIAAKDGRKKMPNPLCELEKGSQTVDSCRSQGRGVDRVWYGLRLARARTTDVTTSTATLTCASCVDAPRWGVAITCSNERSGCRSAAPRQKHRERRPLLFHF